jgi:imidazolonepropionase-like amidohydrolase
METRHERPANTLAILNARLLDPATDYDGPGAVLVEDGRITEVIHGGGAVAPAGSRSSTPAACACRPA